MAVPQSRLLTWGLAQLLDFSLGVKGVVKCRLLSVSVKNISVVSADAKSLHEFEFRISLRTGYGPGAI